MCKVALRVAAAIDFICFFTADLFSDIVCLFNIQVDGMSGILTARKVRAKW